MFSLFLMISLFFGFASGQKLWLSVVSELNINEPENAPNNTILASMFKQHIYFSTQFLMQFSAN